MNEHLVQMSYLKERHKYLTILGKDTSIVVSDHT